MKNSKIKLIQSLKIDSNKFNLEIMKIEDRMNQTLFNNRLYFESFVTKFLHEKADSKIVHSLHIKKSS